MELFEYHRSSASFRVRAICNLKGIEYQSHHVHLLKDGGQQKSSQYLEQNPMGQVPSITHDGFNLSQSVAILEYIEEKYPEPTLLPSDPMKRAKVREVVEMVNSGIHPIQNLAVMAKLGDQFGINKDQKWEWARFWIYRGFQALEKKLKPNFEKHCFGNQITMADLFVIPQVYNARRFGVDMSEFPTLDKIWENGLKVEAIEKALPENHPQFEK